MAELTEPLTEYLAQITEGAELIEAHAESCEPCLEPCLEPFPESSAGTIESIAEPLLRLNLHAFIAEPFAQCSHLLLSRFAEPFTELFAELGRTF